jgi:hypothetical protein
MQIVRAEGEIRPLAPLNLTLPKLFPLKICKNANFVVPLQRKVAWKSVKSAVKLVPKSVI